jgi:hypothetical protein
VQNTRINITNADIRQPAFIHLFFVDGTTCSAADMYMCLTASQTASFLASEFDPGTTGYLIAVATNSLGCPVAHNTLMGDEFVKFSTGHETNLAAEAAPGLGVASACDSSSFTAQLNFDGINYGMLGRALALSNLADRASGNDTMIILNRIGGNLATSSLTIGPIFGLLYNDRENAFSFSFAANTCQVVSTISNNFPRTAPRIEQIIQPGQSGWLKLWSFDDIALFGAVINFNSGEGLSTPAFVNGHNLHKLTLTAAGALTIPVFPPTC